MKNEATPNILLLVLDTVRADHLSCLGYPRATSPNLDRLAREGALFKTAISTGTWTLPSHASIFTGMYPSKHGAHNRHQLLNERYKTLAEFLLRRGYQTACFTNNPFVSQKDGIGRGFEEFHELWRGGSFHTVKKAFEKLCGRHDKGARGLTRSIIEWLQSREDDGRPFFIFANYLEAHLQYRPPAPYRKLFLSAGIGQNRVQRVNQDPVSFNGGKISMTPEDFDILNALYDGEIAYQDHLIGMLFDSLRTSDLIDDTMVIVTSDHGDNIGEHRLMGHEFSLSEQLLRIPLVIRYPRIYKAEMRVDDVVQHVDIFPTIVDAIGGDESEKAEMQGFSLMPKKLYKLEDRMAFAELFAPDEQNIRERYADIDVSSFMKDRRVIWSTSYKYIWSSAGDHELYDLNKDPREEKNLVNELTEKAAEMQKMLDLWLGSFEHETNLNHEFEADDQTAERLRELGYIE